MQSFPIRRTSGILLGLTLAAALVRPAAATPVAFTVDSAQSSITISGSLNGSPVNQQAPGSLTTAYGGTVNLDLDNELSPTTVTLTSSSLIAADSGAWSPLANGDTGTALANYGASPTVPTGTVALRSLIVAGVTPGPVAVTGNQFPSSTIKFTVNSGSVSYNTLGGLFKGATSIVGNQTNNIAGPGSLTYSNNTVTVRVPIDFTLGFSVGGSPVLIRCVGAIVATAPLAGDDTTHPIIVIGSPADFATTTNASILVSGTASDDSGLGGVTVNGGAATLSGGTNWSLSVALVLGTNTITVIATDTSAAHNATTQTVHAVRTGTAVPDTTAPTLAIGSPSDFATTTNASILVAGTATDATGVGGVTVNGNPATVSGTNWSLSVALVLGTNTITVIATDTSANANAATQTVHAVRTAPGPVNHAPVLTAGPIVTNAVFSAPGLAVVLAGTPAVFQAAATDADGDPVSFLWAFGDATGSTDALSSHTYSNCGAYNASITISDGSLLNATPLTVSVPCEFTITSLSIKLVFNKANADSISVGGSLLLDPSFTPEGKRFIVDVGGVNVAFVLDAKGKGVGPLGSVTLKAGKLDNEWILKVSLKKGSFADDLADDGLDNATQTTTDLPITVFVVVGDESFMADRNVTYKATQDKSGSAK